MVAMSNLIVVTGASGKTGRRVTDRLIAAGHEVRAVGRTSTPRHDWADPTTWPAVLAPDAAGHAPAAVYLAYAPDAGFPGADAVLGAFARAAADAGVGRLVLLTGRGEEGALRSEEAVVAAGLPTVIVRSAFFAQGFTEDLLAEGVAAGRAPAARGVDGRAVRRPRGPRRRGRGGPRRDPGTRRARADRARRRCASTRSPRCCPAWPGAPVAYEPVSSEEFRADLLGMGLPDDDAAGIAGLFTELFDGRNVHPTDGVRRALGREPRGFADVMAGAR